MKNHRMRLMAFAVVVTASLMLASTAGTASNSNVTFTRVIPFSTIDASSVTALERSLRCR